MQKQIRKADPDPGPSPYQEEFHHIDREDFDCSITLLTLKWDRCSFCEATIQDEDPVVDFSDMCRPAAVSRPDTFHRKLY